MGNRLNNRKQIVGPVLQLADQYFFLLFAALRSVISMTVATTATPRSLVMGLNPISMGNSLPSLRSPCRSRQAPIGLFAGDALYPVRKAT